jgi:hypothetical protein
MPERTRNHMEPKKRKIDNPAVTHKMTSKYHEVRVVEVFCQEILLATQGFESKQAEETYIPLNTIYPTPYS